MPRVMQPTGNIEEQILKYREITKSSLKAYTTSLRMLNKALGNDISEELTLDFLNNFEDVKNIIDNLKSVPTKKNRLTAILVALQAQKEFDEKLVEKYNTYLNSLSKKYQELQETQEKTQKQKDNWIEFSDFIQIINDIMKDVKAKKKDWKGLEKLDKKDYNLLQSLVLLSTFKEFPIRNNFSDMRVLSSSEYNDMKEEEKDAGNYLLKDKGKYVFKINKYKNVKRLGRRSYNVPKSLAKIYNLFFKFNKSGYFLTLQNQITPLSSNSLTKLLQKVTFQRSGKKLGSSMLRHIQISFDRKDKQSIAEAKAADLKVEDKYLHSAKVNELYQKVA